MASHDTDGAEKHYKKIVSLMANDTGQPAEIPMSEVPTAGQGAESLFDTLECLLGELWQLRIWDVPEGLVDEVADRVQIWVQTFDGMCRRERHLKYCIYPSHREKG